MCGQRFIVCCRESGLGDFNYALCGSQYTSGEGFDAPWSYEGHYVLSTTGVVQTKRNTGENKNNLFSMPCLRNFLPLLPESTGIEVTKPTNVRYHSP